MFGSSREDALHELTATLRSGEASGVREWLQNIVNEDEPDETTQKAAELMERLDQLVPVLEPAQLDEPEPDPNLVKMADEAMAMGVDTDWNSDKEFPLSFDTESPQPSAEYREALLVLDDTTYLHVQPCDTGWDYTLYDVATMKQMDGGQLDGANMGRSEAIGHICEDLGMGSKSIKYAPLSMIETLQEAAYQQTAEAVATQLPDAQEQALDEYPMPDPALTQDDLEKCGYLDGDLLPLSKERAYQGDWKKGIGDHLYIPGRIPESDSADPAGRANKPKKGGMICGKKKQKGNCGASCTGDGYYLPRRSLCAAFR